MPLLRRPWLRGVLPGLLCALFAGFVTQFGLPHGIDDWFFDGCFAARDAVFGPRPTRGNVIIVSLAEEDFDDFKKPVVFISPEIAEVVAHARKCGARSVGVDLMIPNSLSGVDAIVRSEFGKASALGKVVRDVGHVVLPVSFPPDKPGRWPVEQWLLRYRNPELRDPLDRDVGCIDLSFDPDQFVRKTRLVVPGTSDRLFPNFALALVAWAEEKPYRWDATSRKLYLGDEALPADADARLRINWAGPPRTFPDVPFRKVLAAARHGEKVPELDGKIVIVGATARDLQDYHPAPYANRYMDYRPAAAESNMSGVEIHANAVATLSDRAFVTTPWWLGAWPWMAVTGGVLGWVYARLGLLRGLLLMAAHHAGWKIFAVWALTVGNWRVEMAGVLLLGVLAYVAAFLVRWRVLRRVLAAVKSQALAKALEDDPGRLDLLGENRVVTVMFVDVRGFSDFSRAHRDKPQAVVALLNAYFTAVIPAVEREGGTINQFMGDGMMILFNAPLDHPLDHATRAVRAARGLIAAVRANQDRFAASGMPGLRAGVGINTGVCTVGAVGASSRLDYSAIGDVTNAAARLEAATKAVGVDVLIGAETLALIPEAERAALGIRPEELTLELKGVGKVGAFVVE